MFNITFDSISFWRFDAIGLYKINGRTWHASYPRGWWMMNRKSCSFALFMMLICSFFIVLSPVEICEAEDGNILYVGGAGDGNYSSIQDAVDAASTGDIWLVKINIIQWLSV